MTVLSYFDEIIAQINQKIKAQREKIGGAIDIPDWEEAQNVMKQAHESTAALKALKQKVSRLKNDFESSGLFDDDQQEEPVKLTENADAVSQPKKQQTAIPETTEKNGAEKEENKPISASEEKPVSMPKTEAVQASEAEISAENVSYQETQQLEIPNVATKIPDDAWLDLSEDFQNTKIKAVRIDNIIFYVKDMTDALMNVCEWLWKKDPVCFSRMLGTKIAHGKKRLYLSNRPYDISKYIDKYGTSANNMFKKLSNAEIYVWTNLNSNAKANLMANMLVYFRLSKDTVKLAVQDDFLSKERDYSGRTINPDIGTSLLWQDDPTDTHVYSTPTVHKKEQQPEPTQNDIQEKPQTESQVSKVVESNAVVQFCEKMILKRPHKMMIAFTSSVIGKLFENRKNRALSRFQSPHRLSNGVWVETEGITEQQLRQIEKYCDWKVL